MHRIKAFLLLHVQQINLCQEIGYVAKIYRELVEVLTFELSISVEAVKLAIALGWSVPRILQFIRGELQ